MKIRIIKIPNQYKYGGDLNAAKWHDDGVALFMGSLPEITVTPTDDANFLFSQGIYKRNSRPPLVDKNIRKLVASYLSKYDNENAGEYNKRISRLSDALYKVGIQFKTSKKDRASYSPNTGTAYIKTMDEFFGELAHPYQEVRGTFRPFREFSDENYSSDKDYRGGTRYAYPDTFEGETHGFFEPALYEWITTGEIGKSSPVINKRQSNKKIAPKDIVEVADSAASWSKQAAKKRIISMPDQLPFLKRIKYKLIDFPLRDSSRSAINPEEEQKEYAFGGELTPRERLNVALGRTPNGRPLEQGLINVYPELILNPKSLGGAASSALENMGLSFGKKATVKTLRGLVNGTKFLQRVEDKIDNTVYGTLNSARDKAIKSTPQYEQSIQDATKRVKTIYRNSKKANIFPSLLQNDSFNSEPTNEYSFGGELTNGGVFSNGTTIIGNGGTHEENPYDGVQVGMDQEGIPDLVEQGELIWNGYVFSDRLIVPKAVRQKYKLGNKDLTFAEAARKIQKESEERPNDPISKNGLEATLYSLMMEQETMKQEQQGNKYSRGGRLYDGLGPEPSFLKSTPHTIDKMKTTPLSANLNDKISPFSAYGVTFGYDRPLLSGETKLYSRNIDNYGKNLRKQQQGVTDNWMRYAPIAGSAIGLGQTLFSRPDYTGAENIRRAANEIANVQKVGYTPLGEYLTYKPFDTDYYVNKLQAQAGANRRALANQAGGNRAAATASLLALDQDTIGKIGDLARQAEESKLAQKQQVSTFNRATKQANAEMGLKAAMANQEALMKARQARLSGISSAEAMRDTIDARRSAALSAGITGLFDNLGSAGKEKLMMDIVNNNPALLYTFFGNYKNKSSKGGKLNQKRGGFTY